MKYRNLMNLKANSVDPDQTAQICQLIWIYTVRPHNKGVSMEESVCNLDMIYTVHVLSSPHVVSVRALLHPLKFVQPQNFNMHWAIFFLFINIDVNERERECRM
jgi:hypothetical protein